MINKLTRDLFLCGNQLLKQLVFQEDEFPTSLTSQTKSKFHLVRVWQCQKIVQAQF